MEAKATIEDLIAAKSGDVEAVQRVWTALRPIACRCVVKYKTSPDVPNDLMQEAYLAVKRAIVKTEFKPDSNPEKEWGRFVRYAEQWITGCVFRVAVASREWLGRSVSTDSEEGEGVEGESFVVGGFRLSHHALMFAFCQLDDREKRLLSMRFVGGATLQEIATVTGYTDSGVFVAIERVLSKMRDDILFARTWGE